MRVRYFPLFSVECRHEYFASGRCDPVSLRPTAACRRLLDQYQCLFKPLPGGGLVAGSTQESVNALTNFDGPMPFAFDLLSTDPNLLTYTDAAFPSRSETADATVHYFSNLGNGSGPVEEPDGHLLHPPGQATSQAPLPVRSRIFTLSPVLTGDAAEARLMDGFGTETGWRRRIECGRGLTVDLASLAEGRFHLRLPGQPEWAFYLSDGILPQRWGVVEIFPGGRTLADRVPEQSRVLDAHGQPHPRRFLIRLDARRVHWRYYIIPTQIEDRSYESFRVEGSLRHQAGRQGTPSALDFREMTPCQVQGRPARVFESEAPIPLLERPGEAYDVFFRSGSHAARGMKAIKLPCARAETARLEEIDGIRRMCSEIYVYL